MTTTNQILRQISYNKEILIEILDTKCHPIEKIKKTIQELLMISRNIPKHKESILKALNKCFDLAIVTKNVQLIQYFKQSLSQKSTPAQAKDLRDIFLPLALPFFNERVLNFLDYKLNYQCFFIVTHFSGSGHVSDNDSDGLTSIPVIDLIGSPMFVEMAKKSDYRVEISHDTSYFNIVSVQPDAVVCVSVGNIVDT